MSELGPENRLMEFEDEDGQAIIDPEIVLQQMLENPDLQQHMTRMVHEGRENLTAYIRVAFMPGQIRAVVHLPFSPSFRSVPQAEANVADQEGLRVRITDCQKFGIRAEIIRSKMSETVESALVELVAIEK